MSPHTSVMPVGKVALPTPPAVGCYVDQAAQALPLPWVGALNSHLTCGIYGSSMRYDGNGSVQGTYVPNSDYQFLNIDPQGHSDPSILYNDHLWRLKLTPLGVTCEGMYLPTDADEQYVNIKVQVVVGSSLYYTKAWYDALGTVFNRMYRINIHTMCVEAVSIIGSGTSLYKLHKTDEVIARIGLADFYEFNLETAAIGSYIGGPSAPKVRRSTYYEYDADLNVTVNKTAGELYDADTGGLVSTFAPPPWVLVTNAVLRLFTPTHGDVGGYVPPAVLIASRIATDGNTSNHSAYSTALAFYTRDVGARTYTFDSIILPNAAEFQFGWLCGNTWGSVGSMVTDDYRYPGNTAAATADATLKCSKLVLCITHGWPTMWSDQDMLCIFEIDLAAKTFARVYRKVCVPGSPDPTAAYYPKIVAFMPTRHANNMAVFQGRPANSGGGAWDSYAMSFNRMLSYTSLLAESDAL